MELSSCPDCHDLAEALRNHIQKVKDQKLEISSLKFLLKGTQINLVGEQKQSELQMRYITDLKERLEIFEKYHNQILDWKEVLENKIQEIKEFALNVKCEDVAPDVCYGSKQIVEMIDELKVI